MATSPKRNRRFVVLGMCSLYLAMHGTQCAPGPPPPTCETPIISPNGGASCGPVEVKLSTATLGASIRYTTDGSDPATSGTEYISPVTLTSSCTLKTRTFKDGCTDSDAASANFTVGVLPTKVGEVFVIDDFDNKVTSLDLGFDHFAGNCGATESAMGLTADPLPQSGSSDSADGASLRIAFDFNGQPEEGPFAGRFFSLFGLTDTLVSLDGSGQQPDQTTRFAGYYLDTQDIFRGFLLWPGRSIEQLRLDARLESSEPITLKIELKDEFDQAVWTRRTITGADWMTISLSLPGDFSVGQTTAFNWRQVSTLSLIVERLNVADGVSNPTAGVFLIDNLLLVDTDGTYPDLDTARDSFACTPAFLEHVRATGFLYFLQFASTDPRTGGMIQDRSTFADLMTVGGVGFQLTAYCIGAERGYMTREDAAQRVWAILKVLRDGPQGCERVGATGYRGFFYHFLGIDGRRKQNFDFIATPDLDESLNTVELSIIDTALALCGAITAAQYFDLPSDSTETDIRNWANEICYHVDWPFMLDLASNQFYLGWKPNETRDDTSGRYGRFLVDDPEGLGQYSSKNVNRQELPATLDYYTDEGLLIALLAIASPNPEYRVDPSVFFAWVGEGDDFVKTYPGSLFTYQFASCWLDTAALGADRRPTRPVNYFENTRSAITACRLYASDNPEGHVSLNGRRWGLSACEGPFDDYVAEAAPYAAIALSGTCVPADGGLPAERPLEVGTLTVYGVGCSVVHWPQEAVDGLWDCQRLGLVHPLFGFADAFNLEILDAVTDCVDLSNPDILRNSGKWSNQNGFAMDHGPMMVLIDNYLEDQFVPGLFMAEPSIRVALVDLFPNNSLD